MIYTLDDDESFNLILKKSIKNYGLDVKTHLHSEEFTKSIKTEKPDLCIIDLNIDQMGEGFQLLKAIRNVLGDDLPVLVMSRRSDDIDVTKVMEIGADDFLPKPLDDKYLALKLKKYFPDNEKIAAATIELFPVMQAHVDGVISHEGELVKVRNQEFEICFDHYYPKETEITIQGGFVKSIFGYDEQTYRILDTTQNQETRKYHCIISKEMTRDEIYTLKRWIFSQISKSKDALDERAE